MVIPRSVPARYEVVITGAGVSSDPPSRLPKSPELVGAVWEALRASLPGIINSELDLEVRAAILPNLTKPDMPTKPGMRMEQFLETLSSAGAIPALELARIYELVGTKTFNENHVRLGMLDVRHFTLNMDELIELAVPGTTVVHLHGIWNDRESIRTTVAQYSRELDPGLRTEFADAVRGQRVLVLGYSGRDTDVMPVLHFARTARIDWFLLDAEEPQYELEHLRRELNAGGERVLTIRRGTAGEVLQRLVKVPVNVPRGSPAPTRTSLPDALALIDEANRIMALCHLLFEIALYDRAIDILGSRNFKGGLELRRRRLLARCLDRSGDPTAAFKLLTRIPWHPRQMIHYLGNVTEIARLAPLVGHARLGAALDAAIVIRGMVAPSRWGRSASLARVRRAKRAPVYGRSRGVLRAFERVTGDPASQSRIGAGALVDALTWHADALKSFGHPAEAVELIDRARRLMPYANPSQRAWAEWKSGELLAIQGKSTKHTIDRLTAALAHAVEARDRNAIRWCYGTMAEVFARAGRSGEARECIEKAATFGADDPRLKVVYAYHLLQKCAVELAAKNVDAASDIAKAAVQAAEAIDRGADTPALLQALHVDTRLSSREQSGSSHLAALQRIALRFDLITMPQSALRARIDAHHAGGEAPKINEDELVRRGWLVELQAIHRARPPRWWILL